VDRKTRYSVISRVDAKTSDNITASLRDGLQEFPFLSLTNDNGKKFAGHGQWGAPVFFCNPCASWERGTNENTNGLIRQYFVCVFSDTPLTEGYALCVSRIDCQRAGVQSAASACFMLGRASSTSRR